MSSHHPLTDEQLDELLDGALDADATGAPVAHYLAAVRHAATTVTPRPTEHLGIVLAEGLAEADLAAQGILTFSTLPAEQGILTASTGRGILTGGILTRGILTMRTRSRTLTRVLVTKFAALGLLSKAAVAGASVTVAASSAGAAGVLPPPAQVAFDEAVGRQVAEAPADDTAAEGDSVTDGDGTADDGPGIDGSRVAEDATGADGSERGVDGRQIADEASDGRAGGPDEAPGQSGEAPGQSGEAPGQAEEAPGQAEEAPGQAEEAPGQAEEAPGQAEEAPGSSKPEASSPAAPRGRAGD